MFCAKTDLLVFKLTIRLQVQDVNHEVQTLDREFAILAMIAHASERQQTELIKRSSNVSTMVLASREAERLRSNMIVEHVHDTTQRT